MTRRSKSAQRKTPAKKPIEQYRHKDKTRANNPPVGLVTPETDPLPSDRPATREYAYDPHLDPQLIWAGKAERLAFEVPTVSLHVHERIDPKTIIEAVRAKNGNGRGQLPLFDTAELNPPLRDAVEFYKHRHNWTNRLIAGDSLLVMNSLLEKEGLGGQVQMVYIDPPYGIRYGSNFQPFVNKRDVKDGSDDDLTLEPETLKAFRDTWELGIHSYLTYLRDRLLLAKELLHESGSCFVQISDENIHHVRELLDDVFGSANFVSNVYFATTGGFATGSLSRVGDYILWYAKDRAKLKYRQLYIRKSNLLRGDDFYRHVELPDGTRRSLTGAERDGEVQLPEGARLFGFDNTASQGPPKEDTPFDFEGATYRPPPNSHWKAQYPDGMNRLRAANRLAVVGKTLRYVRFLDNNPFDPLRNAWMDTSFAGYASEKRYVVETNAKVVERCLLMTTDPGDLVLDPTCGSGTTAYVAEQWGRRWITTDTSRVAITLAKQRLMTATFDYYTLAHPEQGVGSGFKYKTVPHVTLKSIANNPEIREGMTREQIDRAIAKYAETETLYDQPEVDNKKARVTGPFTVEAVPAAVFGKPEVRGVDSGQGIVNSEEDSAAIHYSLTPDPSLARQGETLRQSEWRAELLKTGIRGKGGSMIEFVRVEALPGTRWLSADAEVKVDSGQWIVDSEKATGPSPRTTSHYPLSTRAVVSFGPEHAPLEQRQVEMAIEEARTLVPKPALVIFAALQFDPEAAKDIDETKWPGVTLLKAQMNGDLVTEDLKKKRSSNESFWLIGQPDVAVVSEPWLVDSTGRRVAPYELGAVVSGLDRLAEINRARPDDLRVLAIAAARGALWARVADAASGGLDSGKHRRGTSAAEHGGVPAVSGNSPREPGGIGDAAGLIERAGLRDERKRRAFMDRLRRDQQDASRSSSFTIHYPLTTVHFTQVRVHGFDYYNPKSGKVESGGKANIAMWMLDPDYDGRSVYPRQVFFPMAGPKDGWARLAKNLRAEIDQELIEQYRGTVSLPFEAGKHGRAAVKIVDDRGIESLRIVDLAASRGGTVR
ncbi:MAG: hypothetical protein FLDDKLPJ_01724 [Phycisphaerae bacterium]|nr:hypothetical protein [Phycisphaerae bacterium]